MECQRARDHTFLADGAHRQFLHSLMICEILASFDLAIRVTDGLRFIGWPEILGKAPEATQRSHTPFRIPVPSGGSLVPDGLFGIEYAVDGARRYRFFALEADRGTMPVQRSKPSQSSYLAKLAAYREIIKSGMPKSHWGLPNLFVLTLTSTDIRLDNIIRISEQTANFPTFLFAAAPALLVPTHELLRCPWRRVALSPLFVDQP